MSGLIEKSVWTAKITWENVLVELDEKHRKMFEKLTEEQKTKLINDFAFTMGNRIDDELMFNWENAVKKAIGNSDFYREIESAAK